MTLNDSEEPKLVDSKVDTTRTKYDPSASPGDGMGTGVAVAKLVRPPWMVMGLPSTATRVRDSDDNRWNATPPGMSPDMMVNATLT